MPSLLYLLLVGLLIIFILAAVFTLAVRIYNISQVKRCTSTASLEGKTVIVTGASAGIGKEAAKDFARRGAKVILACRNADKANKVAEDIIETTGNRQVLVRILDTSIMTSVRSFAKEILNTENRLDVLVLNAGIVGVLERKLTADGLELIMATNHFGHFLLANLLMGLLKISQPSRIVVVSSQAHTGVSKVNPTNLNFEHGSFGTFKAYSLSKLCNVLFTRYLAVYLQGKGVTVNCLCPGFVATEIFEKADGFLIKNLFHVFAKFAGRTSEQGAQTVIYLAVDEDVAKVSGAFFMDCKERKHSKLADDAGLIKKIWELSEDYVKLTPEERNLKSKITINT